MLLIAHMDITSAPLGCPGTFPGLPPVRRGRPLPQEMASGGVNFVSQTNHQCWLVCSGAGPAPWPEHEPPRPPVGSSGDFVRLRSDRSNWDSAGRYVGSLPLEGRAGPQLILPDSELLANADQLDTSHRRHGPATSSMLQELWALRGTRRPRAATRNQTRIARPAEASGPGHFRPAG